MSDSPDIPGGVDHDYLAQALARAGLPVPTGQLRVDPLTGGRTGAQVLRLSVSGQSYVLKLVPVGGWRPLAMRYGDGGEARLWQSGLHRSRSLPLRWPVVDVCPGPDGRDWLLMSDVGNGIRPRGQFSREDSRVFLRALARNHAAFADDDLLQTDSLPRVSGTVHMMTQPLLHLAGHNPDPEAWVSTFLNDFGVMGAFVPTFLELLGPRLADGYLELAQDLAWQERLDACPSTLLHGDLRRANIAFSDDHISLIDWEFASVGPGACDLQVHLFFHFWAYPPGGEVGGDDCLDLRDSYLDAYTSAAVSRPDPTLFEETWKLGWIKVIVQLGFLTVDPLIPTGGTADEREQAQKLGIRAVERALDMRSTLSC